MLQSSFPFLLVQKSQQKKKKKENTLKAGARRSAESNV